MAVLATPTIALAQPGVDDPVTADRDFDFGWIGLLGLVGLAGLMGRDRARYGDASTTAGRV